MSLKYIFNRSGWTNTSGSTLTLQISYLISFTGSSGAVSVMIYNNNGNMLIASRDSFNSAFTSHIRGSGIISLAPNSYF